VNACAKSGRIPLWDTCRLNLRGFPITDYLSKESISAQVEARWRIHKRWGLVAFAGAGRVDDSFGGHGEGETIPSYGVGLRFMVLKSQRINVRVDYARTDNGGEAWYLGVMEAF
jgi:hemolysin activation/secretion protein